MRKSIRRIAFALLGVLSSFSAHAAAAEPGFEGWISRALAPESGPVAEDTSLQCEGQACAGGTLLCATFRVRDRAADFDDMSAVLAALPSGQIAYWLAARTLEERGDLVKDSSDIRGDGFDTAFAVNHLDGREYAFARSEIGAMRLYIALWLDAHALHGMRCSYLGDGQPGPSERIDDLLGRLLKGSAGRF